MEILLYLNKSPSLSGFGAISTGNIKAFPSRATIMLQATAGNPRLANPIINPLSFGMNLQGPSFINFATPNAPVKTEVAKVATNCQS